MRVRTLLVLLLFFSIVDLVHSQDMTKSYLNFGQTTIRKHESDSLNADISASIGNEWDSFQVSEGNSKDARPAFEELPTAVMNSNASSGPLRVVEVVDTIPSIWTVPVTEAIADDGEEYGVKSVEFDFYGIIQIVSIPDEYGRFHPNSITEADISEFWKRLSEYNYQRIISDCNKYKAALGYNDWAVLLWTQALAKTVFPDNINSEQEIFTVFILNQMGLGVRAARTGDHLVMIFSSMQNVYSRKYIVIDTTPFYLVHDIGANTNIFTYRIGYAKSPRPLDLRIRDNIKIGDPSQCIHVNRYSSVWETDLKFSVPKGLIEFYDDYPQLDAKVYVTSAPNSAFLKLFQNILGNQTNLSKQDLLNQLLCFLHIDFKYMVDQKQFGREKPFFCEENFIYTYNDCEDRSILLSVLVRNLLGSKVVILDYKEHMAIAVKLDEQIKGDYLILDNERYYVCDPTYIGATVGMSIPKYRSIPVTVYRL